MRSYITKSVFALALVLGSWGLTPFAEAQTCSNNSFPVAQAVIVGTDTAGGIKYAIYTWDSDTAGVTPRMMIKNTKGEVLLSSGTWYTPFTLKKGAGQAYFEMIDMNSCNKDVRWVRLTTPRLYN